MPWKRMLAYITGGVNEDLLRRIEYLLEEIHDRDAKYAIEREEGTVAVSRYTKLQSREGQESGPTRESGCMGFYIVQVKILVYPSH